MAQGEDHERVNPEGKTPVNINVFDEPNRNEDQGAQRDRGDLPSCSRGVGILARKIMPAMKPKKENQGCDNPPVIVIGLILPAWKEDETELNP